MKYHQTNQSQLVIYLLLLMLIISCTSKTTNPKPQNPEKTTEIPKYPTPLLSNIDSVFRLDFTSGIRSILEDKHGNIWFGSHNQGVCKFDGMNMTYFTTTDGLSDNQVRSIFEDANGIVWFECGIGISSFQNGKMKTHRIKNYASRHNWKLSETDIWFKGDETVGFSGLEQDFGVYRYDGNTLDFHTFPTTFDEVDKASYSVSTPFCKGKNGRVWFGTYGGVFGYDGKSFKILNNESLGYTKATGYLHVRSILEDSKGNLWIGNNGIGVLKYDGKTTINFSKQQGLISQNSGLSGGFRSPAGTLEHVFSIGEDVDGNMWFGDRDTGAWRFDGKSMKNYTSKDGLTTTHIWQIYNSKNGELWFAMGNGHVLKFNGDSFERIF